MKTLVFINSNHFAAKASLEVITYAKKLGGEVIAVTYGSQEGAEQLGAYGASKVLVDNSLTTNHKISCYCSRIYRCYYGCFFT